MIGLLKEIKWVIAKMVQEGQCLKSLVRSILLLLVTKRLNQIESAKALITV